MVHVPECLAKSKLSVNKRDYPWYLDDFMEEKKPYLNSRLTLQGMSAQTGINVPALSAFINRAYQMNFNEYVNMYRVKYFKFLVELPEYHKWTLEAIAYKAGFNSRTTFIRSFTKFCGCSPRDHLKLIKATYNKGKPI